MSFATTILLTAFAALNVWVEPPMARVFPDSTPQTGAAREARLHAAGGEREAFQICIRNENESKKGRRAQTKKAPDITHLTLNPEPLDAAIAAPDVRIVGYLAIEDDAQPNNRPPLWPDPLLEPEPISLAPGETRAFWVTYAVPANTKPGPHSGKLTITYDQKSRITIPVFINVFAFSIPEMPTLRSAVPLDRKAIRTVYGVNDSDLEAWKPFYDALAEQRLSFRIWDGSGLVRIDPSGGPSDAEALKQHLAYAVPRAKMNTIDIGAGPLGIDVFPQQGEDERQDPAQFYLQDLGAWLEEQNWLDRAFVEAPPIAQRSTWQATRDAAFRIKRADKRVRRMVHGPVHPYFERYVELWATPLLAFDAYADAALRDGQSLIDPDAAPAHKVTASSSSAPEGKEQDATPPQEACDGSMFTYWVSGQAPTRSAPEWMQIDFSSQVTSDHMRVIWRNGLEGDDVRIQFLVEGQWVEPARLEWTAYPASQPFAHSWAEVKWYESRTFDALRLIFRASFAGRPVGVTEVMVGDSAGDRKRDVIPQVAPWLATAPNQFPSLGVEAHPVEARIIPWICWGHSSAGFLHDGLNIWPEAWNNALTAAPWVWTAPGHSGNFLFYPGPKGLIPSVRAQLLREGMEDYEYLALLERAVQQHKVEAPAVTRLCARRIYGPTPNPDDLQRLAARIPKDRLAIGWALSGEQEKASKATPKPALKKRAKEPPSGAEITR